MINCDVMHVGKGVIVNILHTPGFKGSANFRTTSLFTMAVLLVNVVILTSILITRRTLQDHRCVVCHLLSHEEDAHQESINQGSDNNRSHMKETMNSW